jgi:hypothetical protein
MDLSLWSISYYIGWAVVMRFPVPLLARDRGFDRLIIIYSFPKINAFYEYRTVSFADVDFLLLRSISTMKFLSSGFSELIVSSTIGYCTKMAIFLLLDSLIRNRTLDSYLISLTISFFYAYSEL